MDDSGALKYAGLMGHEFVVVCDVSKDRRVVGQCNDIETARKWAAEHADQRLAIYRRGPKEQKWKLTA